MNRKCSIPVIFALGALVASWVVTWWPVGSPSAETSARDERRSPEGRPRAEEKPRPREDFDNLRKLALKDPEEACRQALEKGTDAVGAVVAAWADKDPAAAVRWARSLEGGLRETALATLATELASRDGTLAAKLALSMAEGATRNETVAFVIAQWAAEHPHQGLQWARELEEGDLRAAVERRMLPAVASVDPANAADYLVSEIEAPEMLATLAPEILQRWVQTDPEAAIGWASDFADPKLRRQGLDALLRVWTNQDAASLQDWWQAQPEGAFRNEVAAAMAVILAQVDKETARMYASGITDPDLRVIAQANAGAP